MSIKIFTDGACLGNPGPGGWGALIRWEDAEEELSGSVPETTNNRMEILAVIKALERLKETTALSLYTDSQYVKNGITVWIKTWQKNGWKTSQGKPVKNKDLWQALFLVQKEHTIEWCWVKGHSGHAENERADTLASEAARSLIE